MKSRIFLVALLLSIVSSSFTQTMSVVEKDVAIDGRFVPAWSAVVAEDIDFIKKSFSTYLRKSYDLTAKRKGSRVMVVEESTIPLISQNKGDLWLVFESEDERVNMCMSFFIGYDIIINSTDYPEEMRGLKTFLIDFMVFYKTEYFAESLENSTRRLEGLQRELKNNERQVDDLSGQIARTEKDLLKEKDDTKKFEMNNKNIGNKSKIDALTQIGENLKNEITKVSEDIQLIQEDIARLKVEAYEEQQ